MPVQPELFEQGIVISHWSGQVTYEELAASQESGKQFGGSIPFVLILHLDRDVRIPIDIQKNRKLTLNAPALAILVAGVSPMANLLSSLGQRLVRGKDFEYFHTLDEAVVRAREILENHE